MAPRSRARAIRADVSRNDVDAEVLTRPTPEDLISIGVTSVGHRRRLLDAIVGLGPEPPPVVDIPIRAAPERRHLTVMFCDLIGSTPLSAVRS